MDFVSVALTQAFNIHRNINVLTRGRRARNCSFPGIFLRKRTWNVTNALKSSWLIESLKSTVATRQGRAGDIVLNFTVERLNLSKFMRQTVNTIHAFLQTSYIWTPQGSNVSLDVEYKETKREAVAECDSLRLYYETKRSLTSLFPSRAE